VYRTVCLLLNIMSKLRSVNTHFWMDNYIVDLDPIEKLLFLYLLTNDQTNMLGVYEINIRRIAFDTGIDKDMVAKIFERFSRDDRASYIDGYVILHKFLKHQKLNENMKKSAINDYNDLPNSVRNSNSMTYAKQVLPLPKGSEPIRKIEVEVEIEDEIESEIENEICFDDFWNTYGKKVDKKKVQAKWKRLTDKERSDIIEHVPKYVKATPDVNYRKNPLTYLNSETWNDEFLPTQKEAGSEWKLNPFST
jgi:hypothetical protein